MKFCQNCGEAIEDTVLTCPKCNANISSNADEEVAVVYNESNDTSKDNSVLPNSKTNNAKKISPVIMKNRKAISIALAIISVICLIVSITTITSDEYIDSSENYSEYMDNYDENLSISKGYGGYGILGSGYKSVADGWKDLADDELADLWGMRVKAIIFATIGVIGGIATFKISKIKEENEQ